MRTAIVGINWGDEGKGRMVDLLSSDYDVICRYQGGNNAGHTVVNEKGSFILNLMPSGILRENTVNVMGNGMVIDIEHLVGEIAQLREKGIEISPERLKISDKAIICFPFHKLLDVLEEERLADKKYGSTKSGIAPVYGDKYLKKGIRMGDLLSPDTLEEKIRDVVEWKNLLIEAYGHEPVSSDEMIAWVKQFGEPVLDYITNVSAYLQKANREGKRVMFEAQLGALRDIDFGIYPYTSSSSTLAGYAAIGSGIPGLKLDQTIGIMKAYSSCVGEGPFTAEYFGEEARELREAGGEFGARTGRPRRVGPFDVVASRYGVEIQGADVLALTKLDILGALDKVPVVVAYDVDGERVEEFPIGDDLVKAKPIIEYLEGFGDVSSCRTKESLPQAALDYIAYLEKAVDCPIQYVSVGPGREEYIKMFD